MGFLDKLGFGKKAPVEAVIDPMAMMQEHVHPALLSVLGNVVDNEDSDTVTGLIRLDEAMRITGVDRLVRNDAPAAVEPSAIQEANEHLAPLAQLPEQQRFNGIDFSFNAGAVEMNLNYPD
ncbi:hypothetical protein CKALI_07835 [Corynebacterium kalinowskii]|uniref:Uncharacterized protein n=1 Tax=Corynebacterium kalinowskii TaxID=2675216 RepID=A0A6B8VHF4_9CORY|nr:hypothetical protein CKALI_07835 [Corynebacterium kalinowskii]